MSMVSPSSPGELLDQFTLRLNGLERESWAQAPERAARYEMERARKIQGRAERKEDIGGGDLAHLNDNSSGDALSASPLRSHRRRRNSE
ncbi:hypothetical protein ACFCVY_25820 [Streptomyces sp. NPDC056411]|uniref:hypothetical protein n=1 Tax=Streptomyces sp. NPDC056411 TaxID=3345813 RepID=UPI0035D71921